MRLSTACRTGLVATGLMLMAERGAGQTVGVERLVSDMVAGHAGDLNLEPAAAAVRDTGTGTDEVVVAWNSRVDEQHRGVFFRVSLDSGASWVDAPGPLKIPECCGRGPSIDPMAAISPATRDCWVGAGVDGGSLFVARKAFRAPQLEPSVAVANCDPSARGDKPLMAIGPAPGQIGSTETMYLTYEGGFLLRSARSDDTPRMGSGWDRPTQLITCNAGEPVGGNGSFPVVAPAGAGTLHAGTVVVGFSVNERYPPLVTRQDLSGVWANAQTIGAYTRPQPGGTIDNFTGTDVFPSDIRVRSWPSLAIDPMASGKVYMAFAAHAAGQPAYDSDLFIAASSDYGTSFGAVYRLTNHRLRMQGDPNATMEFMPSISVDADGGINLLFYRTTGGTPQAGSPAAVVVRYARFASESELAGSATPFMMNLAGPFTPTYLLGDGDNEYQTITSSGGCSMYAAYVRPDPTDPIPGRPKVYVRRIVLDGCPGDLNGDRRMSLEDVVLFERAFAAGGAAADVNNDGRVDGADLVEFTKEYRPE